MDNAGVAKRYGTAFPRQHFAGSSPVARSKEVRQTPSQRRRLCILESKSNPNENDKKFPVFHPARLLK